jgi:two-component system response regulator
MLVPGEQGTVVTNGDKSISIVIVEDNPADILLIREALSERAANYSLHVLQDGEKALASLTSKPDGLPERIDIFVLDLNLPKISGDVILSHIRQNAAYANTPVLMLSASESPKDRGRAEQLGARYMTKPTNLDEFLAIGGVIVEIATTKTR